MAGYVREFHHSRTQVVGAVRQAFEELGFKLIESDHECLIATSPASLVSWGEEIAVTVTNCEGVTRVDAKSEASYQVFDWGKSDENITSLFASIERVLLQNS